MREKAIEERVMDLEALAEKMAPVPEQLSEVRGRLERVEGRLGAVESQIVQVRTDLDGRTIAILDVIDSSSKAIRKLIDEVLEAVRSGDEQTRREMRVLHEDLVARITLLGRTWERGNA